LWKKFLISFTPKLASSCEFICQTKNYYLTFKIRCEFIRNYHKTMSSSIKDIIKTFQSRQDEQVEEIPVSEVKTAATTPKTAIKSPVVKEVIAPVAKEVKKKAVEKKPIELVKTITKSEATRLSKIQLSDEFFNSLTGQEFVYEDRRIAYIEYDLYEVFMSLKRKKKLKNISVLINAILNQFVEENKEDIKQILTNARL
jgi:hypothetical protein